MRAGLKRHLIQIQTPVKTKSTTGAMVTTWSLHKSVWASVETTKGFERQSASAAWPGSDSKICFGYVAGVLPTMRILFNDKVYSILNINNVDERNREIELICRQGVSAQ